MPGHFPLPRQEQTNYRCFLEACPCLSEQEDENSLPQTLTTSLTRSLQELCSDRAQLGEKAEDVPVRTERCRRTSSEMQRPSCHPELSTEHCDGAREGQRLANCKKYF